ncbi:MAG: LamG-like jellyroll fold domain-containing protein [Chloroflexota bacterium]|nr:LamG-like jellyroll fold domain-containing protein [Chloroflexota bacterium]
MKKYTARINSLITITLMLTLLALGIVSQADTGDGESSPHEAVETAWARAQELGRYHFATEFQQITFPAPTLSNVGRGPQEDFLYVEGQVDLPNDRLEMTLQHAAQGGTLLNPQSGTQIRIQNGQAFERNGDGEWRELGSFAGLYAPDNDPLAFLAAIKNVTPIAGPSTDPAYDRYTFDVNGPAFAIYMRDQLETALRERGELPPGVRLEAARVYRDMTANGEIWIDADGLPLRLTLQLDFPHLESGEHASAYIKSDFSGFERERLTASHSLLWQIGAALHLPQTVAEQQQLGNGLFLFMILVGLMALVVHQYRRFPRQIYSAITITVLVSMLVPPLVQAQQIYTFAEAQQELGAALATDIDVAPNVESVWNSDVSSFEQPFTTASSSSGLFTSAECEPLLSTGPDADGDGLSDQDEVQIGTDPNLPDTDGDDLTDGQERNDLCSDPLDEDSDGDSLTDGQEVIKLGTDPTVEDTDGDGLTDDREVAGFLIAGERWYTDPLNPDTNHDGLIDGADCPGQSTLASTPSNCTDLDNDGTPDLFDADNDGDGVPDNTDISPFHALGSVENPLDGDHPFGLQIQDLTPNKAVYIDLQLRPVDEKHLTYAMNVLDWPTNDTRGQVQRRLDTTFATTANAAIRASDPSASNGDMRLVPMVSIRIPKQVGETGNLPLKDPSFTISASTTITQWQEAIDTAQLAQYGMSLLKPEADTLEVMAPVQVYPDATGGGRVAFGAHLLYWPTQSEWGAAHEVRLVWLVQMMSDRCIEPEQEGEGFCNDPANRSDVMTVLHIYDDRWILAGLSVKEQHGTNVAIIQSDPGQTVDGYLWHLGHGLLNTFAAGSDRDGDNVRDLNVAEIERRWTQGTTASDDERWYIPTGATDVTTFQYAHSDLQTQVAMTETKHILNALPTDATPTLLFASESTFRSANLADAMTDGLTATLSFQSPSITATQTTAHLSWASYYHDGDKWSNYDPINYINDKLQPVLSADPYFQPEDGSLVSEEEALLNTKIAQAFYLSLHQGYLSLVAHDGQAITLDPGAEDQVNNPTLHALGEITKEYKTAARNAFKSSRISYKLFTNRIDKLSRAKYAGGATGVVLLTTGLALEASGIDGRVTQGLIGGLSIATAGFTALRTYKQIKASAYFTGDGILAAIRLDDLAKAAKKSPKGALAEAAFAIGLYVAQGAITGKWDDPRLISDTAASIVLTGLLFAIGLAFGGPVGFAAAVLFAFLDGIALVICAALDVQEGDAGSFLCNGMTGALSQLFYDTYEQVDMTDENRLRFESLTTALHATDVGMVVGNGLTYTLQLYNGLKPVDDWGDDEREIKDSVFAYSLDAWERNQHENLDPGSMQDEWEPNQAAERYEIRKTVQGSIHFLDGGINVPSHLYLNEGYVILREECYLQAICRDDDVRDTIHHNLADQTVYDVLPATLGEFYHLEGQSEQGYALDWGQIGTMHFPLLIDADGDGLLSQHVGGSDPDDGRWDTDIDGLSDMFEHQIGTDPNDDDSDDDGLSDAQELILGTHPNRPDTDHDGLADGEELAGWEYIYGVNGSGDPLRTWVRSDPLSADPDLDDILDAQEKRFGFHPQTPSEPVVLTYDAAVRPQNEVTTGLYARPDDVLTYEASVTNNLFNRHAYGQLETAVEDVFTTTDTLLENFFLLPREQISRTHTFNVEPDTSSGVYRMSQAARAYVQDPRTDSENVLAHYPFDDLARPFLDMSGNLPGHHITCLDCPQRELGQVGYGMSFDGSDVLTITNSPLHDITSTLTVMAWIKPDTLDGIQRILSSARTNSNNGFSFGLDGNHLRFTTYGVQDYDSTETLTAGRWVHVAAVFDADYDVTFYVDGVLVETVEGTAPAQADDDDMALIGAATVFEGDNFEESFTGGIDDLRVYNRVISPIEMGSLMVAPNPSFDLILDVYELVNPESGGTNVFYDRDGVEDLARCGAGTSFQNCPSFIRTPWGLSLESSAQQGLEVDNRPSLIDLTQGRFTQSMWVWADANPSQNDLVVIGQSCSYFPSLGYDGFKVLYGFHDGTECLNFATPQDVLSAGQWNHVAATFDGTEYRIYVNGDLAHTDLNLAGRQIQPVSAASIGFAVSEGNGLFDEIKIFRLVLSPAQIRRLAGGQDHLWAHLPFEDPPGATVFDNVAALRADATCTGDCPVNSLAGRAGNATRFDGGTDTLEVPVAPGLYGWNTATIAAWFKGSGDIVRSEARLPGIHLSTTGAEIQVWDSNITETITVTLPIPPAQQPAPDTWSHIAVTFSGIVGNDENDNPLHQTHLYVNGQQVTATVPGPEGVILVNPSGQADHFSISSTSSPFNGLLDDVRIYRRALTTDMIKELYAASAPALWLRLDEEEGETSFTDSAGNHDPVCTICPLPGYKGQLGLAAAFTGTQSIQATGVNELVFDSNDPFTFWAWIKPEESTDNGVIIAHDNVTGTVERRLQLQADGYFDFYALDEWLNTLTIESDNPIRLNSWTHVALTYDGIWLKLYINGHSSNTQRQIASSLPPTNGPLMIGQEFHGRLDEVRVYRAALGAHTIEQLYELESAWVEERSRFEVTVDNDQPTTAIRSTPTYLPNRQTILDVYAYDPTSGLAQVELLVDGKATNAPFCQDNTTSLTGVTAFCPTFAPAGEGRYQIQSRATDLLSYTALSEIVYILVDDTAPTLTVDQAEGDVSAATPSPATLQQWSVHLNGTASDPALNTGQPGSGMRDLSVTLYNAKGQPAGQGTTNVPVDVDETWQLDYVFNYWPTGVYTLTVVATDGVGNTSTMKRALYVDNAAPEVRLSASPSDTLGPSQHLEGIASETLTTGTGASGTSVGVTRVEVAAIPADLGSTFHQEAPLTGQVLHLPFELIDEVGDVGTTKDISGNGYHADCTLQACPERALNGFHLNGLTFDGVDDALIVAGVSQELSGGALTLSGWIHPEEVPSGDAQALFAFADDLSLSYNASARFVYNDQTTGEVVSSDTFVPGRWYHVALVLNDTDNGALYVNGIPQATFTTAVRPSATTSLQIGGLHGLMDEVQLFNRALAQEEVMHILRGHRPVLWLDFESAWMTDGYTLTERSGWAHEAILQSGEDANKAVTGIVNDYALSLDGLDDHVEITGHPALDLSHGLFTQMAWVYPNGDDEDQLVLGTPHTGVAEQRSPSLYITERNKIRYGFGDGVEWLSGVTDVALTLGGWNFVAATFDGAEYRIYVNGEQVHTDDGWDGQTPYPTTQFFVGGPEYSFIGRVDEVRIYPRTLSGPELNALYHQGWQTVTTGGDQASLAWSTPIPAGLEGLYTIELRATDGLGNVSRRHVLWQGMVDTLAPRVVAETDTKHNIQAVPYSVTVEDFNLSEAGFASPCSEGVIPDRSYYEMPWYLALTGKAINSSGHLYQLTASCPQPAPEEKVNACDTFGNCISNPASVIYLPLVTRGQ